MAGNVNAVGSKQSAPEKPRYSITGPSSLSLGEHSQTKRDSTIRCHFYYVLQEKWNDCVSFQILKGFENT